MTPKIIYNHKQALLCTYYLLVPLDGSFVIVTTTHKPYSSWEETQSETHKENA